MDIGLREWLIIGGALVILLIILDGWRRIRGSRNALRMDIDRGLQDQPGDEDSNPELPNGGARVIDDTVPSAMGEPGSHIEPSFNTSIDLEPESSETASFTAHTKDTNEDVSEADTSSLTLSVTEPESVTNFSAVAQEPEPELTVTALDDTHVTAESSSPSQSEFDLEQPVMSLNDSADAPSYDTVSVTEETIPNDQVFASVLAESADKTTGVNELDENTEPRSRDPLFAPIPEHQFNTADGEPQDSAVDPIELSNEPLSADPLLGDDLQGDSWAGSKIFDADPIVPSDLTWADINPAQETSSATVLPLHARDETDSVDTVVATKPEIRQEEASSVESVAGAFPDTDAEPQVSLLNNVRVDRGPTHAPDPENSLLVMVVSNSNEGFNGQALLQLVLACGMRFGAMDVFHRFEDGIDAGAVQFSMANATQDGSFDLETMADQRIRAVTFYMSMNEPREVMNAFDCMLATAETVARHLNGDLVDENRIMMRAQTQEHYRQRVRDFEMHNLRRRSG